MPTAFTPLESLLGGSLIGLAATLLMLALGRIMGATGILAGLLLPKAGDWAWRAAVVLGMATGPAAYLTLAGRMPPIEIPVAWPQLIVGGLIVGMGVTFASGCTSGHGVCGLARLSPRSLAAVLTFMATTAATVYVVRHVAGG